MRVPRLEVLKTLKGTDLYPKLLGKFKNIDGIDLGEEFVEGKSTTNTIKSMKNS